jgi:glyoxylase-like metal-dependent hydrolase (beta-lactamase superfamily II)
MQRERVAESVYYFQSEVYAQVTAGAVIGPSWAVVIDTLATPDDAIGIRTFIEQELEVPVRYVINTHYHADHCWGNCFFPGAMVVAHQKCYELLEKKGVQALQEARKQNLLYRQVKIVLPHLTFNESQVTLRVGKKNLILCALPGPSPDNIGVLIEEDRILFAGDAFMPLPYLVDGDIEDLVGSLKKIGKMGLENVVPGHGDIILRGEIDNAIQDNQAYLSAIRKVVRQANRRKYPMDLLSTISVESCGKSHVLIGGLAEELHRRNLRALYQQFYGELPKSAPEDDYDDYEDEEDEEGSDEA